MRAIIIDDIELARKSLMKDVQEVCSNVELVGEASGVVSGLKLIKDEDPDLVFLDIDMEDGTGFDLLDILGEKKLKVIFVTASNDQAIKAFRVSAVDYLLKPVDQDLLIAAVEKAGNANSDVGQMKLLQETMDNDGKSEKIALHTAEKILVTKVADIVRCEAVGNYTHFYFADGSKLLVTRTLKDYDIILSESGFYRVHQSHLVNLNKVKAYIKAEGGYILMNDGQHVPVSVRKKPAVVKMLTSL